ncbi:MAG TPA: hypothetical protein PK079_09575 [Leptospiraceae bacterium]|nr:hypothetical protein [Leptospiraceae bacterium]HMW04555.1 hypothetical protein [Leptospiraceae bacterium]HMX33450.1 hypothetical protein [Leptospiraceae bacterium]HMY30741.1 hypothetical protein [Leptospiraceae bacterium]HMZ64319.1 hypothetical protein [Leptospiraceae bacterium]
MKFIFLLITLILANSVIAQENSDVKPKQKFFIPATEFINPGFKITLSGTSNASHSHSRGPTSPEGYYLLSAVAFRNQASLNTAGGQFQRDAFLTENIENYSYLNQKNDQVSPLGKLGFSYTTKSGDWSFEVSIRAKNYSGNYALGNNVPFEYYPGTFQYNWREGQYAVIRNHALVNFLMVQPELGIREISEKYNRNSDLNSYPFPKNYSSVSETSRSYSAQSGLTFHFKIIDSFRIKLTGKIFQALSGEVNNQRTDFRNDGISIYARNINSKLSKVDTYGNEIEGEIGYSLKKLNLFLGYNLTTITKAAHRDSNYIPIITTNENLMNEYIRYYLADTIYALSRSTEDSVSDKPRHQIIKYFYFGASINF